MFWRRKNTAVVEQSSTTATEDGSRSQKLQPREIVVSGKTEEITAYVALCEKVGINNNPAVRMLQLQHFLAERGIPVYDPEEVRGHLRKIYKDTRNTYGWSPLREEDKEIRFEWPVDRWKDGSYVGTGDKLYPRTVPASVLRTVVTIAEKFPDAKFFVTDIDAIPDPFLGVTFPGQDILIVDFWNEPAFHPKG